MWRLQFCNWNEQRKFYKRFFKEKDAKSHFPADGEGTLSGVIVETNFETGLAKKIVNNTWRKFS